MFTSTMALFYVLLFILSVCYFTFVSPTEIMREVTPVTEDNNWFQYNISALFQRDGMDYIDGGQNKTRVKRNGAGKFSDAASMTPMKVMQLFFSFTKNVFTTDPIGGVHPMSRSVPKPIVQLFKNTIIKAFFPDLSPDH